MIAHNYNSSDFWGVLFLDTAGPLINPDLFRNISLDNHEGIELAVHMHHYRREGWHFNDLEEIEELLYVCETLSKYIAEIVVSVHLLYITAAGWPQCWQCGALPERSGFVPQALWIIIVWLFGLMILSLSCTLLISLSH